ncbi:MAG: hypothetical protein ACI4PO_01455 [Faecousia sp.]
MNQNPSYPLPFKVKDNSLYYCAKTKNGYSEQLLCNFLLQVVREIIYDDGAESSSRVTIAGIHHTGRPLQTVEMPSGDALKLEWVQDKWGMDCIIENPSRVKKALQTTADSSNREYVYGITGWRNIGDQLEFLMPGDEKITVRLEDKLRRYGMERSFTQQDLEETVQLLRKPPASEEVFWPLLAFVFLSPLNHFLEMAGHVPNFVMLLQGRTGTRKSTLAALVLSFFGKFTATSLPMSFRDTANYTLSNAFALKDVLTCIDDFHPTGKQEEGKLTNIAQTIMRAYGDRTGRGRLRQDCSTMASRPPQGNAIITAEMAPNIGESATARYFSLELREKDVDLDRLTEYQTAAENGVLQRCMYAYICWLKDGFLFAPEQEAAFVQTLKQLFQEYRSAFQKSAIPCHGRVAEIFSWLQIGMDMLLLFLKDTGCLSENEVQELKDRYDKILLSLASRQADNIIQDKPAHKFIQKLYALLESGQVILLPKNSSVDLPPFHCIGYKDDTFLYLFADLAHKTVRKFCEEQGESFCLSCKALLKALAEEGLLEPSAGQNTKAVRVGGTTKRLLCLYKDKAASIANHV